MNDNAHDQARSGQSSAGDAPESLDDVAKLLADRRNRQRSPVPDEQPTEDASPGPSKQQSSDDAQAVDGDGEESSATQPDESGQAEQDDGEPEQYLDLDGEQVSLSQIREWKSGGMRDADYRRKTQALSEQSKSVRQMEEILNQVHFSRMREIEETDKVLERRLSQFADIDLYALSQENPAKAAAIREQREAIKEQRAQMQANRQRYADEWQAMNDYVLRQRAQAALPELKAKIPGWNDAMYAELTDHVVMRGADAEVVNRIVDPWFWELVADAMAMRKGKSLQLRHAVKLTPTASVKSGTSAAQPARRTAEQEAIRQAKKAPTTRGQETAVLAALQARRKR